MYNQDGFDVNKMYSFSLEAIKQFAKEHRDENFYAFTIDASMLCLNSVEQFEKTLKEYQERYPKSYTDADCINELKYNSGDWEYQGFAEMSEQDGFNDFLYSEHYHLSFEQPKPTEAETAELFLQTPYHKAMQELLTLLENSGVFDLLNKTADFRTFLSEHNY